MKQIANGLHLIHLIPHATCIMSVVILLVVIHVYQEITSVLKIQKVNQKTLTNVKNISNNFEFDSTK
jgi:hypothetical protein